MKQHDDRKSVPYVLIAQRPFLDNLDQMTSALLDLKELDFGHLCFDRETGFTMPSR